MVRIVGGENQGEKGGIILAGAGLKGPGKVGKRGQGKAGKGSPLVYSGSGGI